MTLIVSLDGKTPQIPASAFTAPTATLSGDVVLGEKASAFYGVSVRGDSAPIRIGAETNLQDNVVVHADQDFPATVGDRVSVGHSAVIHGCTIGNGTLVGMSATIMNGAVIGEQSLVAAGALVLEGTQVPPRSLVAGVPAKVRRELSDEEVASLDTNAANYLALSAKHKAALAG
jgi:carbonic anhydrase/acetyltransferase-like protein (isoleucine patch superfamily)